MLGGGPTESPRSDQRPRTLSPLGLLLGKTGEEPFTSSSPGREWLGLHGVGQGASGPFSEVLTLLLPPQEPVSLRWSFFWLWGLE